MDDSVGSGGGLKKKSSSGCLIVKKKGESSGSGGVGGSVSSRTTNKEVGSGDESMEHAKGKNFNDKVSNDPIIYSRKASESSDNRKRSRLDLFEFDEYDEFDMRRIQNEYMAMLEKKEGTKEFGSGSRAVMVEKRKRAYFDGVVSKNSGMTDFDDSDDDSDEDEDVRNPSRSDKKLKSEESVRLKSKTGVLKVMVDKKKKTDTPSVKKFDDQEVEKKKQSQSKHEIKKKIPVPKHVSSDSERSKDTDEKLEDEYRLTKSKKNRKIPVPKHVASDSERSEDERLEDEYRLTKSKKVKVEKHMKSENIARENNEVKSHKSQLDKSQKTANTKSDWTERPTEPRPPIVLAISGSMKAVKKEEKKPVRPELVSPVQVKERKTVEKLSPEVRVGKLKRCAGITEKQKLRENIRVMLINAGWTIDYRPRRGRDYLDSVYISPSGTGYWSIIKAYDAFQKQDVNKEEGESSSFAPFSDDLLKKLTRRTRKKMEEEMKRNNAGNKEGSTGIKRTKKAVSEASKNDSDDDAPRKERLGSSVKQNGKPKKVRLHGDDSNRVRGLSSDAVQARKARNNGRCTLLARNPEEGLNTESDGYIASLRKRTLLAWLIDTETLQLSEKVQYMNQKKTRVKLEGRITREGINCGCCSKILTVLKFELHAGSKLRQPLQNIVLESGISLLECLLEAWNKQDEPLRQDYYLVQVDEDDPDDDTCGICADGGDLICCDGCPSTFHQKCLGIKMLPDGDWHCPNCTCKFCGTVTNAAANSAFASELQICCLCERKYHKSCNKRVADPFGTSVPPPPYCGKNCQEIHDRLQKIIGVKHELQGGLSWSILHRTDLTSDTESPGYPLRIECNSKLAVALSVMDECFLPIIDRRSGMNQIRNIVYNCGSNFNRLNYRGFYTVVLERGDEIISAASIRIRGTQLAEMPFIGTRNMYRRQGMCRHLLSAVESVLSTLNIEKLVIPAISEHVQTWSGVFGFKPLENSHRKELKSLNLMVFPGVDMLQKPLAKIAPNENKTGTASNESSPQSHNTPEATDIDSSGEEETKVQDDIASGAAMDSDSSGEEEETKVQGDVASGAATDSDSSGEEETKVQGDVASGAATDSDSSGEEETKVEGDIASGAATDSDSEGEETKVQGDIASGVATDSDSEGEETKVQGDNASGVATDSDSEGEETKGQVATDSVSSGEEVKGQADIESGVATDSDSPGEEDNVQVDTALGVDPHVLEAKCQSPIAAPSDSVQLETSSPNHMIREDGHSSAKDLTDCSDKEESHVQLQDAENSNVIDAKSELCRPAEASHDVVFGESSLKLLNGQVLEAVTAPIEQKHSSPLDASISNGVEDVAVMELPSVTSPSKAGDINQDLLSVSSPSKNGDINQDIFIVAEAGDVRDSDKINGSLDCIPMEEDSSPSLAKESGRDVQPSAACVPVLQSSDGKNDCAYAVGTNADAENQFSSELVDHSHTLDSSVKHPSGENLEVSENEGDTNLSVSLASEPNQQPSSIDVCSTVASGETVADESIASGETVADESIASGETVADKNLTADSK